MTVETLSGLTAEEIFLLIEPSGFKQEHAVSIANSIYKKGINDLSGVGNIPKKLRDLAADLPGVGLFKPIASEVSSDRTVKYLFRTAEGMMFETVYIPDRKRTTVCVSTQSGCRMGCSFCATARYGFHGNLSASEIVNQVISIPGYEKVSHVVFMGMGEPMDNISNVLKACCILTSGWGLALSPRNITVSTVGITPGIEKFLEGSDCNLALSLFSPFPEERKAMVPVEIKYPVRDIIWLLKGYPVRKKRRLSLAYVMIKDVNDTDRHLSGLKSLAENSRIRVNLLPYHPAGSDKKRSSSDERMMFFKHNLVISGVSASIRQSRGADISAACGLLATGLK
jgi:23S rRNA (adenine2503-C2)-methyltransferase